MSEMEIGGLGETADQTRTLQQGDLVSNPNVTDPLGLFWHPKHRYCASCRGQYLDIYDGRCGSCIQDDLRFCRACGFDVADMVNRDFARRFREASNDVASIWSERRMVDNWWRWQQVLTARERARVS
jgi:hypothetical protein